MKLALLVILLLNVKNFDCRQALKSPKISPRLNFFDIELLRYSAENKEGNVVVSPASVKSLLVMLLEGARGETAKELERALRVYPLFSSLQKDLKTQFRSYIDALNSNSSSTVLHNANGIFVSKKHKLNKVYESIVKLDYHSEVTSLEFDDPNAASAAINNWATQKTHGLIPVIVEPVHIIPPTDLILANALYFKSTWHQSFDPRDTRGGCFYRQGNCHMVAMMDMETDLNYAFVDELMAHALELPYEGKRYSMILLVPIDREGSDGLLRDLPYISLSQISEQMQHLEVQLSMPKFTVDYNTDLVEPLRKIQISALFSSKSNLSGIFEGDAPYVNSFQHKVVMSVDESGTVAAAASSALVVPLIFNGGVEVKVDRPFVFFIRDNELGIVLFEGKIEEPTIWVPDQKGLPPVEPVLLDQRTIILDSRIPTQTPKRRTNSFASNLKNFFG